MELSNQVLDSVGNEALKKSANKKSATYPFVAVGRSG